MGIKKECAMKTSETKEYISRTYDTGNDLVGALSLLYNGFIYNKSSFIDQAGEIISRVREAEKDLTEDLFSVSQSDDLARLFSPVPAHMERIASNLEHIARAITAKIKDNVLFSDKAVLELNFLFQRTKEILNTTNDLILARNIFLAGYIKESESEIETTADKFTTLHEERLIEGICLPKSSSLYILMIDSIKRIAWNAKGIAEKLTK